MAAGRERKNHFLTFLPRRTRFDRQKKENFIAIFSHRVYFEYCHPDCPADSPSNRSFS